MSELTYVDDEIHEMTNRDDRSTGDDPIPGASSN